MLQRQYVGAWGSLHSKKLSLWVLKLEFQTIVTSHDTILLLIFLTVKESRNYSEIKLFRNQTKTGGRLHLVSEL